MVRQADNSPLFERYREFHRVVANRITRPDSSWKAMFDWLVAGHGEIVFGYLADQLVSAAMTVDGTRTAYYASAVYDRNFFNNKTPLAHWPLWLSMQNARNRVMLVYDVGEIPPDTEASSKEVNIGFFKRGFASEISTWSLWSMDYRCIGGIHNDH